MLVLNSNTVGKLKKNKYFFKSKKSIISSKSTLSHQLSSLSNIKWIYITKFSSKLSLISENSFSCLFYFLHRFFVAHIKEIKNSSKSPRIVPQNIFIKVNHNSCQSAAPLITGQIVAAVFPPAFQKQNDTKSNYTSSHLKKKEKGSKISSHSRFDT